MAEKVDPTQPVRDAIGGFISNLIPKNSPLSKSLEESKNKENKTQELANIQRAPAVVDEPSFIDPTPKIEQPSTVTPMAPQSSQQPIGYGSSLNQIDQAQKDQEQAFNQYNQLAQSQAESEKAFEIENENKRKADEEFLNHQKFVKEQEALTPQRKSFWANKSTANKIVSGIGLFLASLTPEGARNAVKIIDNTIDNDLNDQALKYNQKGKQAEEALNSYKIFRDRYKDDKLARLAVKNSALEDLKVKLQQSEAKTNNVLMKEKIKQGYAELQMRQDAVKADFMKQMMEQQKELAGGSVPGYTGYIKDQTAAREFRQQVVDADAAGRDLKLLLKINEMGLGEKTLSKSVQSQVDSARIRLQGNLRTALLGPGTVNDSERELLQSAVADPTAFFSLKSSNRIKLKSLMDAINSKLAANARVYGLQKEEVGTPSR